MDFSNPYFTIILIAVLLQAMVERRNNEGM